MYLPYPRFARPSLAPFIFHFETILECMRGRQCLSISYHIHQLCFRWFLCSMRHLCSGVEEFNRSKVGKRCKLLVLQSIVSHEPLNSTSTYDIKGTYGLECLHTLSDVFNCDICRRFRVHVNGEPDHVPFRDRDPRKGIGRFRNPLIIGLFLGKAK